MRSNRKTFASLSLHYAIENLNANLSYQCSLCKHTDCIYNKSIMKRDICKLTSIVLNCVFAAILVLLIAFMLMFGISCECEESNSLSLTNVSALLSGNNNQANSRSGDSCGPEIDFSGRYELDKTENFDNFLKELGVGYFKRSIAKKIKSEYDISKEGDYYVLKTISSFKTSEIRFKPGESFAEKTLNDDDVMSNVTVCGNKWVHKQFGENKVVTTVRVFDGDVITNYFTVNDATAIRTYRRKKDE